MKRTLFPGYTVGTDAYDDIPAICAPHGTKAVIIGGHRAMAAAADAICRAAEGSSIKIIDRQWYGGEASVENIERLKAIQTVKDADMIFAVGGGKAIDTELSTTETYRDVLPDRYCGSRISGFVSIMRGCNNFCHYCIVPYTRGRERSRDVESILKEVADLAARGYKEVTLLGQNVNSYCWKTEGGEVRFPELLRRVAQSQPGMRVRFSTSHPKDMSDETLRVIAEEANVCRHIHLPVQSGSNRILNLMNRKYTREWYLDRVAAIRRIVPDCGLSTDIFAGYCSETEEDHRLSLSLMEECAYDSAFMFKYSERPGTYASRHLADDVEEATKVRRLEELIALQNRLSAEANRRCIGKEYEILVEGVSKRSRDRLFGRTEQNRVVVFDRGNHRPGEFVRVRITDASSATLQGEEVQ